MGIPPIAGCFIGQKPNLAMHDDWGYPYFRKTPFDKSIVNFGNRTLIRQIDDQKSIDFTS